jgi:FG-GAP-like repeat/FG-GAP repeat
MRYRGVRSVTRRRSDCKLGLLCTALLLFATILAEFPSRPGSALAQTASNPFVLGWSSAESARSKCAAWGDVDGDGDLDLAIGTDGDGIGVYRNDGGTLTSSLIWSSTENDANFSVAWGDLDGDGDLDLAVGNFGQNRLYRNDGGTLTNSAVWSSAESHFTTSIAWGDLDGDGDLDLAVGNHDIAVQVYRNDGGMLTSSAVWSSAETDDTHSVAWGDVDGDGDLDLATGNFGKPNRLYRNDNGILASSAAWSSTESDSTMSVAWGDVDSDGDLDLAVSNSGQPNALYRNDNGVLSARAVWTSAETDDGSSVAWGDVDADGDLDLAVANYRHFTRLYSNIGGTLTSSAVWSSAETDATTSVAWGDVEGDGHLDLVVSNYYDPNRLYRNMGGVLTSSAIWSSAETDGASSVAWGDVDGDGDLDLAVGSSFGPAQLYRNDGGTLTSGVVWSSTEIDSIKSVAWGDVDGDGDLDLAVGNFGSPTRLYRNDGGTLTDSAVWSSAESDSTMSIAWGDVDGDGDLDLAAGSNGGPTRLYRSDAGILATSATWFSIEIDTTTSVAWGDVDSDGDLDLVVGNYGASNRLYRNDGGMLTSSAVWSSTEIDDTNSVALGDVDGDGDLDLAVGNDGQPNRLYRNDGSMLGIHAAWSSNESEFTHSVAWGDVNGDGHLDLVVGNNLVDPNRLYRNDRGTLMASAVWFSAETDGTTSVAWGDVDGDGDLDLAVANQFGSTRLYRNGVAGAARLSYNSPRISVTRPGPSAAADFFASSTILQQPTIAISYTLSDPEGDPVRFIRAFYSPNGGGNWFPATAAAATPTTNLAAAPSGTTHTFTWQADADLIKNDNVTFRIEAYPSFRDPGSYQRPYAASQTFPFRVQPATWYAKVVDPTGTPIPNALVYYQGQPAHQPDGTPRTSDRAGLLKLDPLSSGQSLVVLAPQQTQPSIRAAHDGWAYRTTLTNLSWATDGSPHSFTISQAGEQRLLVQPSSPLILFNLVVSVEWDATDAYLQQLARALRGASAYLFDLTDGQLAFGQVTLYENAEHWADADIQVATNNIVRPHAYVGGLTGADTAHVMRVGRAWDGQSGNQGEWDQPDGYRTLAHEFGHYALGLYDEYFGYEFDAQGRLLGEHDASCTGPANRNPASDATNASAMDYQYTSSELAMQGAPGLWTKGCEATAQWQLNRNPSTGAGESDWDTLVRRFGDTSGTPPRWRFTTPGERGGVLAGPAAEQWPAALPRWPEVLVQPSGGSLAPRQLTVQGPQGSVKVAVVALYKQNGRVLGQGFTDAQGQLTLYGATTGDTVRAATLDGGLAGSVVVGSAAALTLQLTPVQGLMLQSASQTGIPHLRIIAEPSPDPQQIELTVVLEQFGAAADPSVLVSVPGSSVGQTPLMHYSPSKGTWEGQLQFSASARGTGRVQVAAASGAQLVRLQTTYRLQQVRNDAVQDVYADDGNLSLHLAAGSLPGKDAYLVVMPPGALPGSAPSGRELVGNVYDLSGSGALVQLERPGVLTLHYDRELVGAAGVPAGVALYRWVPSSANWQAVASELEEGQQGVVAPVQALGTYALFAPSTSQHIFLPIVRNAGR